jgi:diguanylate cyclase (GGDEF)-like protein
VVGLALSGVALAVWSALAESPPPLPAVALGGGLVAAWLIACALWLARLAWLRGREAEEASRRLQAETAERGRAEAALRESESSIRSLFELASRRNRELLLISDLGGLLQTCDSSDEAYQVISRQGRKLFPELSGAVYLFCPARTDLERVVWWGSREPAGVEIARREDCWALRLGREHLVESPEADLVCRHLDGAPPAASLCVPMLALGEALGVLHLREEGTGAEPRGSLLDESRRRLAVTVAERLAMALANLNLRETLRYQSIRDPLTGLFNRRYFEASLDREIRRVKRRGVSLGILLLDLDHFKLFNDAFGHEAGDVLLKAVGELLRRRVRGDDVACRYGGEEFALILPEAPLEVTRSRAEDLRRGIKELQVLYEDEPLGAVSLSVGVAVFPEHGLSGEDLVRAADAALYQSKAAGRDRVTVAPLAAIDRRLMLPD